jgi:hypothetical protein
LDCGCGVIEMNITSAKYFNDINDTQAGVRIIVDNVTMDVPLDPTNRHYAEILKQVEEGTLTIADAD